MATLNLDENEVYMFRYGAAGYGVEVSGGTAEDREATLRTHLDDPIVVVDGRTVTTAENLVKTALLEIGVGEEEINQLYNISGIELRRALTETRSSLVILEFDSMDRDVQTNVSQMIKGIAEGLDSDENMLGYACEQGGAVVRAEPDLSARVRSWKLEQNEDGGDTET